MVITCAENRLLSHRAGRQPAELQVDMLMKPFPQEWTQQQSFVRLIT
jgi:hypothetical protein